MKTQTLDNIIRHLFETARDHPTDRTYDHLLNTTVHETVTAMFTAENNCRKYKTGANDWTPIYKEAAAGVAFWRMAVRRSSGKSINTRALSTQQRMLPTTLRRDLSTTSTNKATKMYRMALTHRRQTNKHAEEHRLTWLEQLDLAKATHENTTVSIQTTKRINAEKQRKVNINDTQIQPTTVGGTDSTSRYKRNTVRNYSPGISNSVGHCKRKDNIEPTQCTLRAFQSNCKRHLSLANLCMADEHPSLGGNSSRAILQNDCNIPREKRQQQTHPQAPYHLAPRRPVQWDMPGTRQKILSTSREYGFTDL